MKKIVAVFAFGLILSVVGCTDQYEDAMRAASKGDYQNAYKLFSPLAEQGNANAQTMLAVMYRNGEGVPQDYLQGHMWLNLAAANGDSDSIKNRDDLAKQMTPSQVEKVQKLVSKSDE